MPPSKDLYLVFLYSILATLLSEYFWAKAATLLGANLATIAYTLIVLPSGMVIDFWIVKNDIELSTAYLFGLSLIVFSFMGISWLLDPEPEYILTKNGLQDAKIFRHSEKEDDE